MEREIGLEPTTLCLGRTLVGTPHLHANLKPRPIVEALPSKPQLNFSENAGSRTSPKSNGTMLVGMLPRRDAALHVECPSWKFGMATNRLPHGWSAPSVAGRAEK